ncbi:MAG: hypothetical protein IAE80_25760 [Anaerolinea sp.]|nr:hypothetical protein [Anaerolinea sp.]
MTYISPRAVIEDNVYIGRNTAILAGVHLKRGTVVEDNCIVGKPSRVQMNRFVELVRSTPERLEYEAYDAVIDTPTIIGENVLLHSSTIIYSGCSLDEFVITEDNVVIRWDTRVGASTKLMVGGFIGAYITIGKFSRVGGLLGNRTTIGDYVTTFGNLLHSYKQYGANRIEPAPIVEDYVMIGYDSNVIGGVTIGKRSYVAAGATVSKDVPPDTVVTGQNQHRPMDAWQGSLRDDYLASFPDDPLKDES